MKPAALRLWMIVVMAGLSSAFGLIYSQLLVKVISSVTSQFMTAQTVTLGCYIGAMGLGSYLADWVHERNLEKRLPQIQLALAVTGLIMVFYVYAVYFFLKFHFVEISDMREKNVLNQMIWGVTLFSQPVALAIGLTAGLELNLLVRLGARLLPDSGSSRVLAGSYAGTVGASLVFMWVMPSFSPLATALGLAALNLIFSLLLAWVFIGGNTTELRWHAVSVLACAVLVTVACNNMYAVQQLHMKSREMQGAQFHFLKDTVSFVKNVLARRPEIIRHNTGYQKADFIFQADGGFRFLLDYHPQIERYWNADYHEAMVHAPIQYYRTIPKQTLVLGGGDGVTVRELLKYGDSVESIDVVELDPWMIHMAKTHPFFLSLNEGSFSHPKVRVHAQDAIVYLRTQRKQYDAIFIDFPFPFENELVKLFSVEFYQLAARLLKPDGQLVVDAPAGCTKTDPLEASSGQWRQSVSQAMVEAGFQTILPYCSVNGFVLARKDNSPPFTEFQDFGIRLEALTPQMLHEITTWKRAPNRRWKGRINSMFKPLPPLKPRHF